MAKKAPPKSKKPATNKSELNDLKKNNGELVLVSNGDDWEGLYVNGKKVFSHHNVEVELISEWSAKLQMVLKKRWVTSEYNEYVQDGPGDFHEDLKDVKLEPEEE